MTTKQFDSFLIKHKACKDGYEWAKGKSLSEVWSTLDRADWMLWLYGKSKKVEKKKCVMIAVYSAELCLPGFEKFYPDDKRPRLAIEAAKRVIENDTKENRDSADSASGPAWSAALSAAFSAARSAAYAAEFARFASYAVGAAAGSGKNKEICDYIRKLIPKIKL